MNFSELEKKLFAAARVVQPRDGVPYAFEQRIMARLKARPVDVWAVWARGLWRAAAACVLVTVVLGAVSINSSRRTATPTFSDAFETTIYATVEQPGDAW